LIVVPGQTEAGSRYVKRRTRGDSLRWALARY
jgi:hypothetical protein